jgi:hypothetical protein
MSSIRLLSSRWAGFSPRLMRAQQPNLRRQFSSQAPRKVEVSRPTNMKNFAVAAILLTFVSGVYYAAISKMKQTDDLADLIEEDITDEAK